MKNKFILVRYLLPTFSRLDCMAVMSTKIPDDLKARVDRFPYINWSEIMRSAILEKLLEEERKEFHRNPKLVVQAIEEMDMIRRKASGNSTEELRKWREQM